MLRVLFMDIMNIQHSTYQCWYVLSCYTLMQDLLSLPTFPLTSSLRLLPSTVPPLFFPCNAIPSVRTQLKLLPCFSPPRVYQLLSNGSILGQSHWISKPSEAPGTATSQPSTRYHLATLSVPQGFLIHFRIATLWNKTLRRIKLPNSFFQRKKQSMNVIYTNKLFFVFEGARNTSPHTFHGLADKQWLSKRHYFSCSLSSGWYAYSLAILLFRATCQSEKNPPTFPREGKDAACLVSHWLILPFLDSWIWLSYSTYHRIQNKSAQVRGLARPTVAVAVTRAGFPFRHHDRYRVSCLTWLWTPACPSCPRERGQK